MLIPDIRTAIITFGAGVIVGVLPAWYLTSEYKDGKLERLIAIQKVEAAKILQSETERVIEAERFANNYKDKLEKQHANSEKRINATLADNRRLTKQLGGLRDPGRRTDCQNTVPRNSKTSGVNSKQTSQGRLSDEASGFLLELAADADKAAEYALMCHKWANGLNTMK